MASVHGNLRWPPYAITLHYRGVLALLLNVFELATCMGTLSIYHYSSSFIKSAFSEISLCWEKICHI